MSKPMNKKWMRWVALAATALGLGLIAPTSAQAAPYCGITWGSLPKEAGGYSTAPLTNVRAGRHDCYDRIVMDIAGGENGFEVQYVTAVHEGGSGNVVPLRGGAFLEITLLNPAYDENGQSTYNPLNRDELVNVNGWRTFRQAAWAGSYEGSTTIGLGVRARLPFRAFSLDGPGDGSRVVIDVAHLW